MGAYSVREESRAYIVVEAPFPNNWHQQMLGKSLLHLSVRQINSLLFYIYGFMGSVTRTVPSFNWQVPGGTCPIV